MSKTFFKILWKIFLYGFAIAGFLFVAMYFAVKWHWTDVKGVIDQQTEYFRESGKNSEASVNTVLASNTYWAQGEEWATFKNAVLKDRDVLLAAARDADVSPRLILSCLAVEQLRLYYSDREIFKGAFAPLKILGNQSQFSWGIMGIKPETAVKIEENLKDSTSLFYINEDLENLLDFTTDDHDQERFERIVNEKEHYYSYLYGGVYIKEILSQWQKAGFDISKRPEIVATLYNIGFEHSKPNPTPRSGGAEIQIGEKTYSFGSLAAEIYYSSELREFE